MSEKGAHYIGQRLSYLSLLCTICYIGEVTDTVGTWLGVEWDDPLVGKHAGSHKGVEYFRCKSSSPKAASFVRPRRPSDKSVDFLEAIRHKYVDEEDRIKTAISFNTKVAEEVGFDKIKYVQGNLEDLRVALIDGQRLASPGGTLRHLDDLHLWHEAAAAIESTCPKVRELDLSHNLLESLLDVACICRGLPELWTLTLNGNRFRSIDVPNKFTSAVSAAFESVTELNLNETLLTWDEIIHVTGFFTNLRALICSANALSSLPVPLATASLQSLTLSHNHFFSLASLSSLTYLPNLKTLSLHDNSIANLLPSPTLPALLTLDLSSNDLPSLSNLNPISNHFPSLVNLRLSGNPFFTSLAADDAHMLSLARVNTISSLNYSDISPEERENAELYYLSRITAELGAVRPEDEDKVLTDHPLWSDLCAKYGPPMIKRADSGEPEPGTLGARLLQLTLSYGKQGVFKKKPTSIMVPKSINVYMLKAIVGDAVGMIPLYFKLVWETGEWDPVSRESFGKDKGARFDIDDALGREFADDDDDDDETHHHHHKNNNKEWQGRWIKREVELVEGTSSVGFWIEGKEAQIRVDSVA